MNAATKLQRADIAEFFVFAGGGNVGGGVIGGESGVLEVRLLLQGWDDVAARRLHGKGASILFGFCRQSTLLYSALYRSGYISYRSWVQQVSVCGYVVRIAPSARAADARSGGRMQTKTALPTLSTLLYSPTPTRLARCDSRRGSQKSEESE